MAADSDVRTPAETWDVKAHADTWRSFCSVVLRTTIGVVVVLVLMALFLL
jgi:hypothetical protein